MCVSSVFYVVSCVLMIEKKLIFAKNVLTLYLQEYYNNMEVSIVKIGNSRGFIISKTLLEKYNIKDKIELIFTPFDTPWHIPGWKAIGWWRCE